MKKVNISLIALSFLLIVFLLPSFGAEKLRGSDPKESFKMVMNSPSNTFIIDVRTKAEYEFVGHPDIPNGVPNIPYKFYPSWEINKDFVKKVDERYKKDDTIITMCRSGKRAKAAAKLLLEAGFKKVFYMIDSFEGPKNEKGYRTVSGWKVNGLPYTYEVKDNLVYK